jgi:Tol biopolymer transport system component
MNMDGTDVRSVTDFAVTEPDWAPDGSRLAFGSERDGTPQVYVVDADGTNLRQITSGDAGAGTPGWAPDGRHLAYEQAGRIVIEDLVDGTTQFVTPEPAADAFDILPQFSPDGRTIAYVRVVGDARKEVRTIDVDGTGDRLLSRGVDRATSPDWSADGQHIVFNDGSGSVSRGEGDSHLFVVAADGSDLRQITSGPNEADFHPSWTPDGSRILFTRYEFAPVSMLFAIYSIAPDGSDPTLVFRSDEADANDAVAS